MKRMTYLCFLLFLAGLLIFLLQIWVQPWSVDVFVKLLCTDGAFLLAGGVGLFIVQERRDTEKLRKGRDLD